MKCAVSRMKKLEAGGRRMSTTGLLDFGPPASLLPRRGAPRLRLLRFGEQADGDSRAAVVAEDFDLHHVVEFMLVEDAEEVVLDGDLLAVDGGDDVAEDDIAVVRLGQPLEAGGGRRAVRVCDLDDEQPLCDRQADAAQVGDAAREDAELGTDDAPVADELRDDAARDARRDGEADADRAARRRKYLRVDADHAPLRVEERPAR